MATKTLKTKIIMRNDTAENWRIKNPILDKGEIGVESDTHKFKIGDNVIVEGISVDYPNTKAMIRHWYKEPTTNAGASGSSYLTPLLATVTIDITTSEALTAQTYSKMLWLKTQTDQGSFGTSTAEAKKFAKDTAAAAKGIFNKGINLISNLANGSTVNTQHLT